VSSSTPLYFEEFRTAAARLPAGLIRPGPPASVEAVRAAETRLGRPLPRAYAEFLRSFDGADLFHESIVICGVGPQAFRSLLEANATPRPGARADDLVFGEALGGDIFLLEREERPGPARVFRLRAETDERWLAGSSFPRWLEATLAREQVLYGPDGEFVLDAFEADGEELTPRHALRQAERGVRKDPGAAEHHYDLGVAWRRLGRQDRALKAFAQAAALDPENPWPWFDLGRAHLAVADPAAAADSFRRAAEQTPDPAGARHLAWAARAAFEAGDRTGAQAARDEASARHPGLLEELRRAAAAAEKTGEKGALGETQALLQVFDPAVPLRHRLPLVETRGDRSSPGRRRKRSGTLK
jgi:tetratricopeptide (TPR) repeat protein